MNLEKLDENRGFREIRRIQRHTMDSDKLLHSVLIQINETNSEKWYELGEMRQFQRHQTSS